MALCTSWVTGAELVACGCTSARPDTITLAAEAASEVLYNLTAQQFPGVCTELLRPCAAPGNPLVNWATWPYPWVAMRIGGAWVNMGPCGCHQANDCSCSPYPRVNLGRTDVQSVDEVNIDGDFLPAEDYRLDSNQYLVRTDGSGWPCCQDLGRDAGEIGTWYVELTYGWPVPADLRLAARALASEYVKLCNDDDSCRLPRNATSAVRDGVSVQFIDVAASINSGQTGLWEVDQAVMAHNPNRLNVPSAVWTPESASRGLRSSTGS